MSSIMISLRRFFRKMWNRQFLTFLFFLVLSTTFWFLQTLNEVYEEDFDVPVEVRNMPRGVVLTSDLPPTVKVTLRDRGVTLLNYMFGDKLPRVVIDPAVFTATEGRVRYFAADLLRQIRPGLASGTQVVSIKPDTLEFYYNHGRFKRVPVRLLHRPTPAAGYTIAKQELTPDSVTVYAAGAMLDTITAAYASADNLHGVTASATAELPLQAIRGVKFTPNRVKLFYAVDRLVEKKVTVPILSENFPADLRLRTFPSQVEVNFQVPMTLYRTISADLFSVVVDYNSLPADGSTKCSLIIRNAPAAVSHVRLASDEVEYVLETDRN